jgi:tetratricopeptide (TPR) repeat protein
VLSYIARVHYRWGDYDKSESFYQRALEINEKVLLRSVCWRAQHDGWRQFVFRSQRRRGQYGVDIQKLSLRDCRKRNSKQYIPHQDESIEGETLVAGDGVRSDAGPLKHPFKVEEDKPRASGAREALFP